VPPGGAAILMLCEVAVEAPGYHAADISDASTTHGWCENKLKDIVGEIQRASAPRPSRFGVPRGSHSWTAPFCRTL